MSTSCAINTDNLLTISKSSLESRIASLSADKLEQLDDALRYSLASDSASYERAARAALAG